MRYVTAGQVWRRFSVCAGSVCAGSVKDLISQNYNEGRVGGGGGGGEEGGVCRRAETAFKEEDNLCEQQGGLY